MIHNTNHFKDLIVSIHKLFLRHENSAKGYSSNKKTHNK